MDERPVNIKKMFILIIIMIFILNINSLTISISLKKSYVVQEYTLHDPIYINGNYEFTSENGVTGGMGWVNDPYIIEGWEINASSDHGITIEDTNKCFEIRNCYIHSGGSSKDGIVFYRVKNGAINSSVISNNRYGIFFRDYDYPEDSSYNKIFKNTITNNKNDGIHFEHTLSKHHSYNLIFLNDISHNNRHGIYMIMSAYNQIFSNNFISNTKMGVNLTMCMGGGAYNRVYHNNFIDNSDEDAQASAWWTSYNDWDDGYPSGGNFWNDYQGLDEYSGPYQNISGSDGIGDTPYELLYDEWYPYEVDYDFYPLMNPWGGNLCPFAEFNWIPFIPYPGEMVFFNASQSIDYDGYITIYQWDWNNDGIYDENLTSPLVNHTYEEYGYYPVVLNVIDNESYNNTISKTVRIGNLPPIAVDDFYYVQRNSYDNVLDILDNDYDPDHDSILIKSATDPQNGTIIIYGDYITYTPDLDFNGRDEFSYTIIDIFNETDSAIVNISVNSNDAPYKPWPPSGPTRGKKGVHYNYTAVTMDPDSDDISYLFDWGDETTSGWIGFVPSGTTVSASHAWEKGEYEIKVKAKDIFGIESEWSDTLKISIPRNRITIHELLNLLFNRFSNLERLISLFRFI